MTKSVKKRPARIITIPASELGPRNRSAGEVMTAHWPDRVETFTYDGRAWVLTKTEAIK